jgi:uncharacterized membrane protein
MHAGHPVVVHFALALLLTAAGLDVLGWVRGRRRLHYAATLLWLGGLAAVLGALATGLLAYNRVDHSDIAHLRMTTHRFWGLVTAGLVLAVLLARWRRARRIGVALAVLVAASVGYTGLLGGELVYTHALGIPTTALIDIARDRGALADTAATRPAGPEQPDSAAAPAQDGHTHEHPGGTH